MPHLSDEEILRLVANELDAAQTKAAREHLRACPSCETRVSEKDRLWNLLGAWE